jgi:hypothetical protein
MIVVTARDTLIPLSRLKQKYRKNLDEMEIGDLICCRYTAAIGDQVGTFSDLGTSSADRIPFEGAACPDGTFYFVLAGEDNIGRKFFIADRNIQHSISWNTLAAANLDVGRQISLGGKTVKLCLPGGGLAPSDFDNDWDQMIVENILAGTTNAGDNSVWHWDGLWSWTATANDIAQCQIRWDWQDNSTDENGFHFCDTNGNVIATLGPDTYEYVENIPGTGNYIRKVRAFNDDGESRFSNLSEIVCPSLVVQRGMGAADGRKTGPSTACDATTGFRPMLIYDPLI